MKLPRVSIAGMMAAVAVVALDCFALITTGGVGVLLIGLILSVGFACWWRGHGRGRRFWLGFEVAGLVTVLVYVFFARSNDELIAEWPMYVLDLGLKRSPLLVGFWTSLSKQQSQIAGLAAIPARRRKTHVCFTATTATTARTSVATLPTLPIVQSARH